MTKIYNRDRLTGAFGPLSGDRNSVKATVAQRMILGFARWRQIETSSTLWQIARKNTRRHIVKKSDIMFEEAKMCNKCCVSESGRRFAAAMFTYCSFLAPLKVTDELGVSQQMSAMLNS
jgi:hypothetical protein